MSVITPTSTYTAAFQERVARIMDEYQLALQDQSGPFSLRSKARESMREAVISALKEQDRDTRHACAEAVAFSTTFPASKDVNDAISRAHVACVNASAV